MVSANYNIQETPPKCLTFDVFGTVVNWRKTVTETLISCAEAKTASSSVSAGLAPEIRRRVADVTDHDWATFAQQWRDSYKKFVKNYDPDTDEWRDIDTHHRLSLLKLLQDWQLTGLYNDDEIEDLSKVWHFLEPWPEASEGLRRLGKKFVTSTLSNGNQSLLKDLQQHGDLGFKLLQSSEDFKAYKPHPKTYQGAAKRLECEMSEVAMVAAHLSDLQAARGQGMRTIYVARPREEDWAQDSQEFKEAREWVDLWIEESEEGFVALAERFGI